MRRNPTRAWTKSCKTTRLRQAADLIDQRREQRKTNRGRENSSEWVQPEEMRAALETADDSRGSIWEDRSRSRINYDQAQVGAAANHVGILLASRPSLTLPVSLFIIPSHPLAVAPALLFSFSFSFLPIGLQKLETQPGGGDRNRSLDP